MTSKELYCIERMLCVRVVKENAPFTRRGAFCELKGLADGTGDSSIITFPYKRRNTFVECYGR